VPKHDVSTCRSRCCEPNVYVETKYSPNVVRLWLYLISTKANATKLRARLSSLKSPPLDTLFGPEPLQCPLTVLYGAEVSRQVYANDVYRPALDAWDNGTVTPDDLRRWCLVIENGGYSTDLPFSPMVNASFVKAQTRLAMQRLRAKVEREVETKVKRDPRKGTRKVVKPIDWSLID
jgi:hypothetical protein